VGHNSLFAETRVWATIRTDGEFHFACAEHPMKAIHEIVPRHVLSGGRRTLAMFGLLGLLSGIAAPVAASDRQPAKEPSVEALIERVRTAVLKGDSSNRGGAAVRKLLAGRDEAALVALRNDSDPTIGVFAAWELFERSGSRIEDFYRFVGYVEARAQVRVEKSFEAAATFFCVSMDDDDNRRILPRYELYFDPYRDGQRCYLGLTKSPTKKVMWSPPRAAGSHHDRPVAVSIADSLNWSEDRQAESVTVAGDGGRLTIPMRLLGDWYQRHPPFRRLLFDFGDKLAYVLAVSSTGFPSPLACFDGKSGELLWEQDVWAQGSGGGLFSGASCHDMQLVRNGERLAVFGVGEQPSIEVFEAATGKVLLRFSTGLWNALPDELLDITERPPP
jgi:hypothetical protein